MDILTRSIATRNSKSGAVSSELYQLGSGLYLKVRINWRSHQHDLLLDIVLH